MADQQQQFLDDLARAEGMVSSRRLPAPIDPLQAQTAFELRARTEDCVAHAIALIVVMGMYVLAGLGLLGWVNLDHSTVAAVFGSVIGYAVGKVDPILNRYFSARAAYLTQRPGSDPKPGEPKATEPKPEEPKPEETKPAEPAAK